jgi:hypothetical protein
MLGFARLTLRQVQEALQSGRLDEAQRLLSEPDVQSQRGVGPLYCQLARAYVDRGDRALRRDDPEAAWQDLLRAEQLQTAERSPERLREALTRLGVAEVRALLQAGEPGRAEEAAVRLRGRGVRSPELHVLEEAGKSWVAARELAGQGEFARALETVEGACRLSPEPVRPLDQFRADLEQRQPGLTDLLVKLHEAADKGRWREVIELAEQVLMVAPQHTEARKLRTRAWKAVEPVTVAMGALAESEPSEPADDALPQRYLLWIDGVGGYLLCLGSRVTIGQATLETQADVPLIADIARLHATLTRDAEGYVLESVRPLQVNGQPVTRALLRPNDRVTLGTSCQFQFHLPVGVSSTARLDLVSGHRLPLALDGVLLMADTLVLGPEGQVHVTVPDLKQPVVLFRHKDGLGLRHRGTLLINGQKSPERGLLGPRAAVSGDDIVFALEPVGARLG